MSFWKRGREEVPPMKVKYDPQTRQIEIELTTEGLAVLRDMAERRNKTIGEVVGEALRLERLLVDRDLFIKEKGRVKELEAV